MHRGLEAIWLMLGAANRYFSAQEPWVLRKSDAEADQERFRTVLYTTLEAVRIAAVLVQPVMPDSAGRLLDLLGQPSDRRISRPLISASRRALSCPPRGVFPATSRPPLRPLRRADAKSPHARRVGDFLRLLAVRAQAMAMLIERLGALGGTAEVLRRRRRDPPVGPAAPAALTGRWFGAAAVITEPPRPLRWIPAGSSRSPPGIAPTR